jgi:hypothetical protein
MIIGKCAAWSLAGGMVVLGALGAAAPGGPHRGVACPAGGPVPVVPADFADITDSIADVVRGYARKLKYQVGHPWGDERELTLKQPDGSFVLGPKARAHPWECAHANTPAALQSGRIVARVTLPATAGYAKLGLPPGVSYVWIDRYDAATLTARAVIFPAATHFPIERRTVRVEVHPGNTRAFPEARWIFDPADDHLWVSCLSLGCCRVMHDEE